MATHGNPTASCCRAQALKQLSKQAEEDDAAPVGLIYTKGLLYDTS